MAHNNDRIVYPREVEIGIETTAKSNAHTGDSNCVQKPLAGAGIPEMTSRCTICVPPNTKCPDGDQLRREMANVAK